RWLRKVQKYSFNPTYLRGQFLMSQVAAKAPNMKKKLAVLKTLRLVDVASCYKDIFAHLAKEHPDVLQVVTQHLEKPIDQKQLLSQIAAEVSYRKTKAKVRKAVRSAQNSVCNAARSAQNSVCNTVSSAQNAMCNVARSAQNAVCNTVSSAQNAVWRAANTVSGYAQRSFSPKTQCGAEPTPLVATSNAI
ncbi:MAG: hypothetical protein KGI83_03990, partial [Verrucomicrobiota bacterium]|nr:hypothetical protein [Verrucomicrobiota bacterium]